MNDQKTRKRATYPKNEPMAEIGKLQPQAVELEEAVLGAMLLENEALNKVIDILVPESFYKEQNGKVYNAILNLFKANEQVDILTVTQELKRTGELEFVGGSYYVSMLTNRIASSANIETHARIVAQKFMQRELIRIGTSTIKMAYEDTTDVFDLMDQHEKEFTGIVAGLNVSIGYSSSDLYSGILERNKRIRENPNVATGIDTGFPSLNSMMNGWQKSDLVILAARPGMGKALSVFSKVLTSEGWKLMGELTMNDKIAGLDGNFYNLRGIFPQGKKEVFKFELDDGSYTLCCSEHLWLTETRKDRRNNTKGSVKDTAEIIKTLRTESDNRLNHSIPFCKPVNFSKKNLPIHPYILGILLGDGGISEHVKISNPEKDILDKIKSLLKDDEILRIGKDGLNHSIIGINKKTSTTKKTLKDVGLMGKRSHEKFIPYNYLHSSVEDRIDLLKGIMDSDGFVDKGLCNCEISTTSIKLKEDIKFLIQSLGGRFTCNKKQGKYRKNGEVKTCKEYYRINFSFDSEIIPCSSEKHLRKFKPKFKPHRRFVKSITSYGEVPCQCISIDSPDNLFITDDFIVTHNTALALCFAKNAAIANIPTAVFSMEMSAEQLYMRLVSQETEIPHDIIKKGMDPDTERLFKRDMEKLKDAPLYIDESGGLSIFELRNKARKFKRDKKIELIIVDYLQLMYGTGKEGNREQEISVISRGLKKLAKELDIPIIALSQLSREVEKRPDKRPQLSDLRDSGSIEQDADMVFFIYNPSKYGITHDADGNSIEGMAQIINAKNRHGSTSDVYLKWIGELTKFTELKEPEPQRQETYVPKQEPMKRLENNNDFLKKDDPPF